MAMAWAKVRQGRAREQAFESLPLPETQVRVGSEEEAAVAESTKARRATTRLDRTANFVTKISEERKWVMSTIEFEPAASASF
jgi:hypothetical protein